MIPGEVRHYGGCDIEIINRKIEPRPEIRGDIARSYLYMAWAYPGTGIISKKNRPLLTLWDRQDPVSPWEFKRVRHIEAIQGNRNPFVGSVGSSGQRPTN